MMKKLIYMILTAIVFLGCEEIVELDLKDADEKVVVESYIEYPSGIAYVKLTNSIGFYRTEEPVNITGAQVYIIHENGSEIQLQESHDGVYWSYNLKLDVGKTYDLEVILENGEEIDATTTLPQKIEVGTVSPTPHPHWGADSINLIIEFEDPADEDNFYWIKVHDPGKMLKGSYYILNDALGPGGTITSPVYIKNFAAGDTAVVELIHMDQHSYKFLSGMVDNINGSFNSIAPGNPESNLPEGYLGYFGAYTITYDTLIVPPLNVLPGM